MSLAYQMPQTPLSAFPLHAAWFQVQEPAAQTSAGLDQAVEKHALGEEDLCGSDVLKL